MFTGVPTQKLGLPNYNPNDHPDFLTDINEAFKKIDDFALAVDKTITELTAKVSTLEAELEKHKTDSGLLKVTESEG